jgi:outer membrane receptor protein involved in Fe transport
MSFIAWMNRNEIGGGENMEGEKNRYLRAALVGGVLVLIAVMGFGSTALAQDPEEGEAEEEVYTEEITVTGTLIPRPTLESLSPVTVMDVEELTYSGVTRIEDLMATLPQAFAQQNSTVANGASGTATVDLRYLGSRRTLVLINGRRMAPGDASFEYAPDLNAIPASLLERVDVLTGGASSVYGSDAVAGVVNFILDTDFEGIRGGLQYSFFNHDNDNTQVQAMNEALNYDYPTGHSSDGDGINFNVALGGKFAGGKGHAMAYFDYRNIDEVYKGDRDYLTCAAWGSDDGPVCGGSSTGPLGTFYTGDAGPFTVHTVAEGGDGWSFTDGVSLYNYAPWNMIQRPDEKSNLGAFINYQFNDHVEAFAEVMFMDDRSDAQIAPSGNFYRTEQINCDNPMLSPQQYQIICADQGYVPGDPDPYVELVFGRRNVEGGPRISDIRHTNFRGVLGIRGDINDDWSYEVYGLHAQNRNLSVDQNDLNKTRVRQALDVIVDPDMDTDGDPTDPANWICRSADARADGCVPWNVFQEGGVTQDAIDFISIRSILAGTTKTSVVNATFRGDLEGYGVKLPSATEGLQVALGAEWREEYLGNDPDQAYLDFTPTGFGSPTLPVDASFNVKEVFMEGLVPLVQDAPGAQDLSLEVAYRYSDYSTSGGTDTYKAMLNYAPVPDVKIRGGINRAIRSANAWELFRGRSIALSGGTDLCDGPTPSGTPEECARTGVDAAMYGTIPQNPANQYNVVIGGFAGLEPETADTSTVGVVVTPRALPGFSAAIDYYDIEIAKAIGYLSFNGVVNNCAQTGDPMVCDLINRDRFGTLWLLTDGYVDTSYQNIGTMKNRGVDLNASHMISMGNAGFLTADLAGTYLLENRFSDPLQDYDCVGYYGFICGQPNSEWRHRLRLTWKSNFNAVISLAWRFIGSAETEESSDDEDIGVPGNMEYNRVNGLDKTSAWNYLDLSGTYNFSDSWQLTFGVNNVLDKEPPLWPDIQDDNNVNTYATYDPLGRFIFTSLRFNF